MKKFVIAISLGLLSLMAFAEATFDQIEGLIQQRQYQAAEQGLEVIIKNHPQSAKAFYAMAQAQAGLGNLEKAKKALDIATGLNPTLDFAPSSSVASLRQAITPQVTKIEAVEESHLWRNLILLTFAIGILLVIVNVWRKNAKAEAEYQANEKILQEQREAERKARDERLAARAEQARAEVEADEAKQAALMNHPNYGHDRFDPENPDKLKTVKRMKEEAAEKQRVFLEAQARREAQARADAAEASARMYRTSAQTVAQPTTTVVHTNNSGSDLLTGMIIGDMMSHHHHDTTRVVEREVVREVPAPSVSSSRSSSWDDTPSTSSRSSSWDDTSSRSSSSWSSSSDSSSSSSWSDSSSSSDSGSSSWD
jgi:hypothetical protein